jgi:transposase
MPIRRTLTLSSAQHAELVQTRDRDRRPYLRAIAGALLKIAHGHSPHWIARHGLLKPRQPDTLYRWLDKYEQGGLAALVHRPRGKRGFPPDAVPALLATLQQSPQQFGLARSRWRLDDLRQVVPALADYHRASLSRLLQRLGVRKRRGRYALTSPDPAYQTKLERIARVDALVRRHPTRARLLYLDEFTLHVQPDLGACFSPAGVEPVAAPALGMPRYYRYAGAIDPHSGQVVWRTGRSMGTQNLARFLRQLRRVYPAERLFVVWDNWPPHRTPAIVATARRLQIYLLPLPTYAPWTNPIEQLWRWLTQTLVHHHRLAERPADLQ